MMIDFEDKMPTPPMTWGERAFIAVTLPISAYCFVAPFITLGRWLISLAQ